MAPSPPIPLPPVTLGVVCVVRVCVCVTYHLSHSSTHTIITIQAVGPGPNFFSNSLVFVDVYGKLHMQVRKFGSQWKCSEIYSLDSLGYGTYSWNLSSQSPSSLPKNVVIGMFVWDDNGTSPSTGSPYREMDVELFTSAFGNPLTAGKTVQAQCTVQPYYAWGHYYRFDTGLSGPAYPTKDSTWSFHWYMDPATINNTGVNIAYSTTPAPPSSPVVQYGNSFWPAGYMGPNQPALPNTKFQRLFDIID